MKNCWISGKLAQSSRGRRLVDMLQAHLAEQIPRESGLCMMSGQNYQDTSNERQEEWIQWCSKSGRTLLLIPPFVPDQTAEPKGWKVRPGFDLHIPPSQGLLRWLANEVRYVIEGNLTGVDQLGGSLPDGHLVTGLYRRHPHAGVLVVTTLPLWSLSLLDHVEELRNWLEIARDLAGQERVVPEEEATGELEPLTDDDFALLLHLCSDSFESKEQALHAFHQSDIFDVPEERGNISMEKLIQRGLIIEGKLSDAGRREIEESPYLNYAHALEKGRK